MHYQIQCAVLCLVHFNKVVAAAQCPQAAFRTGHGNCFFTVQFFQSGIGDIFVCGTANLKSAGNILVNETVQFRQVDSPGFQFYRFHAAANVYTHQIRHDLIRNGHGRPDGTAFSRVNVRHDADFAVPKRFFVADQADLLLCFSVQRRRIAQRGIEFSLYFDHNGDPLSDGAGTCGFHRSGSGYQEAVPGCIRPIS